MDKYLKFYSTEVIAESVEKNYENTKIFIQKKKKRFNGS